MPIQSQAKLAEDAGRIWRGITIPPGKAQAFEIRLYDTVLAMFEARVDRFGVRTFRLEPPVSDLIAKLPFAIAAHPSDKTLVEWLRTRTVPRHQKYAKELLRSAGIDPQLVNADGPAAVPAERISAWEEFLHVRAAKLLDIPQLSEGELEELVVEQQVAREDLAPIRLGLMPVNLTRLWPYEIP